MNWRQNRSTWIAAFVVAILVGYVIAQSWRDAPITFDSILFTLVVGVTIGSIYAVAKAGMTHYTRCLADQLRSYDITVNCIAPGDTRTGRFMGTRAVDQDRMVETGTLDRIATVDEVARVVEVFAGPLGAFVSGQVLRVDGGGQCWAG